jgi:hypothetical protein
MNLGTIGIMSLLLVFPPVAPVALPVPGATPPGDVPVMGATIGTGLIPDTAAPYPCTIVVNLRIAAPAAHTFSGVPANAVLNLSVAFAAALTDVELPLNVSVNEPVAFSPAMPLLNAPICDAKVPNVVAIEPTFETTLSNDVIT